MKIAMIGHKRIPSREGGIEIVVSVLASKMVLKGHTVVAYNRKGHHVAGRENDEQYKYKEYDGVKIKTVATLQNKKFNALIYSFFATLRAACGRYDVVHYHASGPCAMLGLAKFLGINTVATIHGLDSKRGKWKGFASKYLKFGEKMAAKHADELIVLSENVKDYFMTEYGREAIYIPNGIEKMQRIEASIITDKFGLKKDGYILFIARIVPEKGLHYLIEAFKESNTELKLCIVGGTSHSNEYVEELKKMAKDDQRIIFTGFQQGIILEELFSNAYIYVLPSDVEGMPISLLEAMSYGNCCLTSDIAENVNVIGDMGVTFKKGDTQDLLEKINYLDSNIDAVNYYKQNSSDYIVSKYNWDDIVDQTLDLYERVVAKRRKKAK